MLNLSLASQMVEATNSVRAGVKPKANPPLKPVSWDPSAASVNRHSVPVTYILLNCFSHRPLKLGLTVATSLTADLG